MKKSLLLWMSAVLLLMAGEMLSSCNNDDSNEKAGGKAYIVTNQPSAVGVSYAILAGEFYPDNIPSVYNIPVLRLGMELSTTEEFRDDHIYSAYSTGIEGNHMEVTINGSALLRIQIETEVETNLIRNLLLISQTCQTYIVWNNR